MVLSYRRDADHVVPYEHLTGNPQRDTYRITGIDLFPDVSHQVKLWSTEEKERMIANLETMSRISSGTTASCSVIREARWSSSSLSG